LSLLQRISFTTSTSSLRIWKSGSSADPEWRFAQGTLELSKSSSKSAHARIEFEYTESNFNVNNIKIIIYFK
jgi:hypothetical protein